MECAGKAQSAAYIQSAPPLTQEQAVPVINLYQVTYLNDNRFIGLYNILTCYSDGALYKVGNSGNCNSQDNYVEQYLEYSVSGGKDQY